MPNGRIQSLELLRGCAALAVAWFHITHGGKLLANSHNIFFQAAAGVGSIGFHGITLFFILSGFVIPWSMRNLAPATGLIGALWGLPGFVFRRLLRLQPPFFTACILALSLNLVSTLVPGYQGSFNADPYQLFSALLTDNLYLTGLLGGRWILVVAWTLALEVQFYLVAGFFESWAAPALRGPSAWLVYGCALAMITCLALLFPQPSLVFRMLPIFALGWVASHQVSRPLPVHWLMIIWLLLLIDRLLGPEQALVAFCCLLLLRLALLFPFFAPAPLIWLGGISYSLFLTHVPIGGRVVNLLSRWPLSPLLQFLVCLLALVVSVLVGWVFWALIEKPSQRFSRRLLLSI